MSEYTKDIFLLFDFLRCWSGCSLNWVYRLFLRVQLFYRINMGIFCQRLLFFIARDGVEFLLWFSWLWSGLFLLLIDLGESRRFKYSLPSLDLLFLLILFNYFFNVLLHDCFLKPIHFLTIPLSPFSQA